ILPLAIGLRQSISSAISWAVGVSIVSRFGISMQLRFRHCLPVSLVAFMLASPAHAADQTLVLRQESPLRGRATTMVSRLGIHLTLERTDVHLLFKPPKWDVVCFNPKNKNYCVSACETFIVPLSVTTALFRPSDPGMLKAGRREDATLKGLKCQKIN